MAKDIMDRYGQKFDAYYSVIMPDTWTPIFDLTDRNRVDKWLSDGKNQLELVIDNIMSKRKGDFIDRKLPKWVAAIPAAYMYATERKTKKSVWKLEECEMCLGCLHRCPKFAISYGNGKIDRHGQYKNPYTRI